MKVGVALATDEHRGEVPGYARIRSLALAAEAAGLDSLWIFDHLLYRFPGTEAAGVWESWSLLAALAEATERVELGTLVLAAPFRNPALLAKMASTVEEVSGGRLVLGLGCGWHEPEFDAFGIPSDHRVSRTEEALAIVTGLLRDGSVDFEGRFWSARNCELVPRGPRPGGPPILVASSQPRMLGLTARYADLWNTAWLHDPAQLLRRRATLDETCAAEGREPATLGTTVGLALSPDRSPMVMRTGAKLETMGGTPAEVGAQLRAFEEAGAAHAICRIDDLDEAALDWLGVAVRESR